MVLELSSDWEPGAIYEVVCEPQPPDDWVGSTIFDKSYAPVFALNTRMPMGAVSSDMFMRLKKDMQEATEPICFGDKLFFIEEVKDMRFSGDHIYYEYYKKVLAGSRVLWLHKTSGYAAAEYVRFQKLRA